jgi:SAM-dependent methyltransferase
MSGNEEMAAAWDGPEGAQWAENADRYEVVSTRYRNVLIDALALGETSTALDVGCGNGGSTVAAGRIATSGAVLGVDLSSQMLAVGRARAAAEGLGHVRFEQADAQVHPFPAATYDTAFSQFGAMFFADPVAAFANIRGALRPNGSLVLFGWRELGRNEWVRAWRDALAAGRSLPEPPAGAPGPFGMADRELNTERLVAAGYRDVEHRSVDETMCFGKDADDAYAFALTAGITRGLTTDLDDTTRTAALDDLRRMLTDHETPDGVLLAGSAWLVTARTNGEEV